MSEWILLPDVFKYSYSFHSDKTCMYVTFGIRKKRQVKNFSEIAWLFLSCYLTGIIHKSTCKALDHWQWSNLQWCLEWESWDVDIKHLQIQSNFLWKGLRIYEIWHMSHHICQLNEKPIETHFNCKNNTSTKEKYSKNPHDSHYL